MDSPTPKEPRWILILEWIVLLAVVALATFLRFWRIEEVPPGFNSDEAVGAMGALTTLREGLKYSYEGQGGAGSLGFYFAAASFYLFGPSIAAIRGVAAWAGATSIFVNYWAIREMFRTGGLNRARWIAGLSTLALAVSVWHIWSSRVAFATIGVPFLMLPSVFFLWRGLNFPAKRWLFIVSGFFLGSLMYIYLSGAFAPPLYALFFLSQWLIVILLNRFHRQATPPAAYLTSQFWNLFAAGLTAFIVLLPLGFILLTVPNLDPGTTRVSQAIFTNPQINQGDPWGLLWRSFVGNFSAYGVSFSWLVGQPPRLSFIPPAIRLMVFIGFLISIWRSLRGHAADLFALLWFAVMLLPSILSPDSIPHNLRTIGATTPTYIFAAVTLVSLAQLLLAMGRRWLLPRLGQPRYTWLVRGAGVIIGLILAWQFWLANQPILRGYFYDYPQTNDAQAAFHVYAVKLAETINTEGQAKDAYILPRNTAAGDINPNFTTDFLTELAEAPAAHYWVVDDERTLPDDLTAAAAAHQTLHVVEWLTSKHTGADPKEVIPYYLDKYGYRDHKHGYGEYYNIVTYQLRVPAPDFAAGEKLTPAAIDFGHMLTLTGYGLGDAGDESAVNQLQAHSNDLLWLRLGWQKTADHPENAKVSALIYTEDGQLVTQADKTLLSNILHVGSQQWPIEAKEDTYFLIPIPEATPPGRYKLRLAVYGETSQTRLPIFTAGADAGDADRMIDLADFTIVPAVRRAKTEHLTLALPVGQELLPGLTLVGFETLPGASARAGAQLGATVIWQAGATPPAQDIDMTLVIKSKEGDQEWPISEPVGLTGPGYPASQWQPEEVLRGWLTARIPPTLEPGTYELELRLTPAGQPNQELARLPIGDFGVTGWPRNFTAPSPQLPVGANYGDLTTLVGLDAAAAAIAPGETLDVTLYWRADAEFSQDYTAFVQLIGPDGQLTGQMDQTPGGGQFPTTGWAPGENLTDTYAIPLAAEAPPGDYQLAIGLYNPATGQRLPVSGADCQPDVCLLPGLTVK
jgi:hypothetical protein